ncbi:hypothetical protein JVU11DRAFT_384 [Chiua virens]|nr:hypothetical protein JVU11DRAFT_384 [Chiua virens]
MSLPTSAYTQHDNDLLSPLTLPDASDSLFVHLGGSDVHPNQLRVHVSEPAPSHGSLQVDVDQVSLSRPASSTSSLDPYYFGVQSPSDSPPQQLQDSSLQSTTPETRGPGDSSAPLTPARDPASIDRNGLVGVGELSTPRWDKLLRRSHENPADDDDNALNILQEEDSAEVVVSNAEPDAPDSPWTIEAVDGELDDHDQVGFFQLLLPNALFVDNHFPPQRDVKPLTRTIRPRRSTADESGGEEILYPRQPHSSDLLHPFDRVKYSSPEPPSPIVPPLPTEQSLLSDVSSSPPSSFTPLTPLRKAKKRTSEEFEMDYSGSLAGKRSGVSISKDHTQPVIKEEKTSLRKHRSTASTASTTSVRDRARDRRRESSSTGASAKSNSAGPVNESSPIAIPHRGERERGTHTRQLSAGDSSSGPDPTSTAHPRRVHTTDFSHLPPSPSTTSIHQFLKHAGSGTTPPHRPSSSSNKEVSHSHASPNVAHSLLRGTQEGWSSMDDDAHAEALRKLDGLSGKTARARASVGSLNRASVSRPGTPGSTTGRSGVQWEGVGNEGGKISRRGSTKEKERKEESRQLVPGLGVSGSSGDVVSQDVHEARVGSITSGDEHHSSSGPEKPSKKHTSISARLSFTPKRGSASSTNYTSTPTSSRDSASLSIATSATSVSAPSGSGRHSTGAGKGRRNSAGSDISSVYSGGDGTLYKDRTGSLAASAEALEEDRVPPVPPLPKDLSSYRSPPQSSHGITFPPSGQDDNEVDRTVSLEVPSVSKPPVHSHATRPYESANQGSQSAPESAPSVTKTPSKKWSFSNALNIKLTSSPSISSMKDKDHAVSNSKMASFPLSPRSMQSFSQQLRKSTSREHALSATCGSERIVVSRSA